MGVLNELAQNLLATTIILVVVLWVYISAKSMTFKEFLKQVQEGLEWMKKQ